MTVALERGARPAAVTPRRGANATLLRTEWRLFLREPVSTTWGLVLPTVAFIVLGVLPATSRPAKEYGGLTPVAVYQPILLMISLTMLSLVALPPVLGSYRERGVLRRFAVTPMPAWRLLGAQVVIHLGMAVIGLVISVVVGAAAFGISLPGQFAGYLLAWILTAAALLGLGITIAAFAANARVAGACGTILFFPLMFFAGLWVPRQTMSPALRDVSDYTPLGASVRAFTDAQAGNFPAAQALLVLLAYAVVFGTLAVRRFRWQ